MLSVNEVKGSPPAARPEVRDAEALLETGALQRAIFNSANFSSIATDAKGVIQIFNVGAERMLGYTAAEVVNRITPAEISDPQEVVARSKALSTELGTPIASGFEALAFKASRGIEDIYELTYIRKNGTRFPAVVSVTALRDAGETIIGYLLIGTDNTARKHAEEELLKAGALQRAIFNSANFSSIATDAKGVIQIFNVGAERMLGYTAAEVVNRITPAEISDPQEVVARSKALSTELGTPIASGFEALAFKASRGIEDIYELTYIRKDGSRFPAVVSVTALRDAQKAVIGYLLIGTDNTLRKQVEEDRRRAEEKFRKLMESAPDAMVIVSKEGRVLLANAQTEKLFGYDQATLIGKPVEILVPERFRAGSLALPAGFFAEPKAGAVGSSLELFGLRNDGTEFPIESSLSPLQTEEGILVIRDISERRRAEDAAKLAKTELEAFSYSVAHDLRAPLRGMNGFAQVLLDDYGDKLDAEGLDCLKEIHANATRMGGLIDALLSLSKVTRSEVRPQRTDLTAIARAVVGELTSAERRPGAQIVVQSHLSANLDPQLARQLVENLIGNAWKFTAQVEAPHIEFGALDQGGSTAFFVRDNGAGFDMAHAGKLFAPFQRLHTVSEFPGTGIGLATVQRIVQRHGGRAWAEGKVGEGATFFFTVPEQSQREAR